MHPSDLGLIKLVCQNWHYSATRMELVSLELESHSKIDKLLSHLDAVRSADGLERISPIRVKICAEDKKDFYRFNELLPLFQSSVTALYLGRSRNKPTEPEEAIISTLEAIPEELRRFPNIHTLLLKEFHWWEVSAMLQACDTAQLQILGLSHGLLDLSRLQTLHLPRLESFEIGVKTFGPDTQIERSWQLFLRAATALKVLTIHISRQDLAWAVDFLRADAPKTLCMVRMWIRVEPNGIEINRSDPHFMRLVNLVDERHWTKWVCAHTTNATW